MRYKLALISIPLFTLTQFSNAQAPSPEEVQQGIKECKTVSIDVMREACLAAADQFLKTGAQSENEGSVAAAPIPQASIQNSQTDIDLARAALAQERAEIEQARAELEAQSETRSENERLGLLARLGLARNVETQEDDKDLAATITIERVTYNRQKIHTFYTSDGDILRQDTNSLQMRLPDKFPATARLERRVLGSKWLAFEDRPKRFYKVKVLEPSR